MQVAPLGKRLRQFHSTSLYFISQKEVRDLLLMYVSVVVKNKQWQVAVCRSGWEATESRKISETMLQRGGGSKTVNCKIV